MRRLIVVAFVLAGAAVLAAGSFARDGGADGDYLVRAVFDSADFVVEGELVRIAGADVGTVKELDVSRPGEIVSNEDGGEAKPGKAVVVLQIDDPGFQDFREDASCRIRPQSLLGEKFIECLPTQPRSAGSEPPPPIGPIADGEAGEGQHLLPIEQTGKSVDLDLVNNIMREPETERFKIILSDLGAALAARGDDLAEVVERANPALRETDRVLNILADQNRQLAQLAEDSDAVLEPMARERRSVRGFIANANQAAQATAERREELAAGWERMPDFLRELGPTMRELRSFADAGTPMARDLRVAAPPLTRATRELERFSPPAADALVSLGEAAEGSGDQIEASNPVIRQIGRLSRTTAPGADNLNRLLRSLRKTGGVDMLMDFAFNAGAGFNGFDEFGHYMRAQLLVTNCVDYVVFSITGCVANFTGQASATRAPARKLSRLLDELGVESGGKGAEGAKRSRPRPNDGAEPPADAPDAAAGIAPSPGAGAEADSEDSEGPSPRGMKLLMEYLTGDGS